MVRRIQRTLILVLLLALNSLSHVQAEEYRYQGIGHSKLMKVVVNDEGCIQHTDTRDVTTLDKECSAIGSGHLRWLGRGMFVDVSLSDLNNEARVQDEVADIRIKNIGTLTMLNRQFDNVYEIVTKRHKPVQMEGWVYFTKEQGIIAFSSVYLPRRINWESFVMEGDCGFGGLCNDHKK
ncbi:hypothetical protein [uncultured Shewanella sp.]|uniref:hypothetical protein n=1 Tax=uncultured Shewanella sp. TaxID=173975 RepID=UPI002630F7B8|nr:hypothetical protein [uncultured Shewanella sp.]